MENSNIQVAVRLRPLSRAERALSSDTPAWVVKEGATVVEISEEGIAGKRHAYDHAFGPSITTHELYETCVGTPCARALSVHPNLPPKDSFDSQAFREVCARRRNRATT